MQSIAPAPGPPNQELNADNDLRAQLAAVINISKQDQQEGNQQQHQQQRHQQQQQHHQPQQNAHQGPPHGYSDVHHSSSASPHDHDHNIDPAIGGGPGGMGMSMGAGREVRDANDSGGDDSLGDGRRGGKRELSQSKRAAQNRAAQRAFRQRKEGYIKKLEEQVRDLHSLEESLKVVQAENYSLREYIIHLQSRLIESQGEYPQPPPNVNLHHPQQQVAPPPLQPLRHEGAPMAPMAPMAALQASAAQEIAAASLQSQSESLKHEQEQAGQRPYEDDGDSSKGYKHNVEQVADDEMRAQMQADGLPTSMAM
ncbi:hypothetical protein LZ554_005565 [Drepanopeziza brunnea f. sp. 'monogermtubi']|nr:hypothetical protein LZ554_005565 [Drepanopeziza brunnea f. sp. 'monogermtubi']